MAVPLELIAMMPALAAVVSLVIHFRLANLSRSGLFASSLLIAASIAVAALASSLAPADSGAQAVTDTGILLAGTLAFAASGWLIFAFSMAGDAGGS